MSALAKHQTRHEAPRMRAHTALTIGAAAMLAIAASVIRAPPLLIYNGSPSAPIGFYVRDAASPGVGTYVTVRAAVVAPAYAALRHFNDADDRFLKRIAAAAGTEVCAHGDAVRIGDRTIIRQTHDSTGRALPAWSECRALAADEVFLLGDTPDSFDSRYWGPVRRGDLDGVWRRIAAR